MALPLHVNPTNEFRLLHNPYQQAFLAALDQRLADGSRAFQRFCIVAGRRGGKTLIGAVAAVKEAARPGTLGWCIGPTYGDLHDYVLPAVMRVLPQAWIKPGKDGWSAFHQTLTLRNGSQIAFRSGDDPERMRGPGLHWAWIDEGRKTQRLVWDTLRPALTEHRAPAWMTTTPNGFDWVYHTWFKLAANAKHRRPGYWAVKYRTVDNPIISREEIEEARATTDDLWYRQEYEAEFVTFEGAIYTRIEPCLLRDDDEVRQRFLPDWPHVPREFPCIIALDPGADHPFAAVKLVATPAGLLVVDEYCKRMAAFADHADALRPWLIGHDTVSIAIDRTAVQAQIELATHGLITSAAENSVVLGIQRVQSWMKTGRLGIVESRCPQLIEELRSYRWKQTDTNDGERGRETPFKTGDDLCDALRYACMVWPELPTVPNLTLGRDPRTVPECARWAWERERECNRDSEEDGVDWERDLSQIDLASPTGDMWLH